MAEYIIFRAEKIPKNKTSKSGGKCMNKTLAHYRHHDKLPLEHPENTAQNRSYGLSDKEIRARVKNAIQAHNEANKKRFRSDSAVLIECLFSFTPTAKVNIKEYCKTLLSFVKTELHCDILRLEYHADESSKHFHVLLLPFDKKSKTLSANKVLGDHKNMERLQTVVAQYFEHLGLERGIPKKYTKLKHSTLNDEKRRLTEKNNYLKEENNYLQEENAFLQRNRQQILMEMKKNIIAQEAEKVVAEVFEKDR